MQVLHLLPTGVGDAHYLSPNDFDVCSQLRFVVWSTLKNKKSKTVFRSALFVYTNKVGQIAFASVMPLLLQQQRAFFLFLHTLFQQGNTANGCTGNAFNRAVQA